jgi:hypothetical protein
MKFTFIFILFICTAVYSQDSSQGQNTISDADLVSPPISKPTPEDTPESSSILKPLLDLLTGSKSFALPNHYSECYKPRFTFLSKTFVMSQPCTELENNRGLISLISLVSWSLVTFKIIMSA